jgi:acyl carrier protein
VNEPQIYERLTKVFRDVFDDDAMELKATLTAREVPGWDSFTHINLVAASEIEFGVKFTTSEIESMKNVGDFVALIGKKSTR